MSIIIDADVHISPYQGAEHISADELISRMDYTGVDKALTWITPPYLREIDESNRYLYEASKKYPDRILPFGWANPKLGVEKAKDMVKRCVVEYGFLGVKLNGAQNEYYIDDPQLALPVIEEIAKTGKAIAFHTGADSYEHTHPFRVAKIAKMYPELPVLAAHMGGAAIADLSNACIEFAQQCPNIMLIGSSVKDLSILKAIRTLGPKRVCFGSDTPFALMHASLAMYRAMLEGEGLSAEEWDDILGGNIARFFKLPCV